VDVKEKKIFKKICRKTACACLSALTVLSLTSCESIKLYFAGEITDMGISIDSVASGKEYIPEIQSESLSKSPYDTVYNNCLFVGGSVMCDFYKSVLSWRDSSAELLSGARFFCNESFGVYENNYIDPAVSSSHHPTVERGKETFKCTVEDAIEYTGAERVVFCLAGINDLPVYGDEENCHIKTANEMAKLVKALKKRYHNLSIIVISAPPISAGATYMKSVNNEKIALLNSEMSRLCVENGADFINVSSFLCDENGALKGEYCSDGYCKINEEGCKVLLSSLRYYAKERKGEI
jgi:hypothetical protein